MTGKEETDMIKMQNVRKVYPGFDFELSMEIPEGRITGLIGKNGAGKSTAIRLMLGLAKADGGIIELFGKPITEIMAEDRQNIGVSLAESGFNGQFTIVEVEKILAKMYPKLRKAGSPESARSCIFRKENSSRNFPME